MCVTETERKTAQCTFERERETEREALQEAANSISNLKKAEYPQNNVLSKDTQDTTW